MTRAGLYLARGLLALLFMVGAVWDWIDRYPHRRTRVAWCVRAWIVVGWLLIIPLFVYLYGGRAA